LENNAAFGCIVATPTAGSAGIVPACLVSLQKFQKLAGAHCVIPYDEVVLAMRDIGRRMPRAPKEPSLAGLAAAPAGPCFTP